MSKTRFILGLALSALMAGAAVAQQPGQPRQPAQPGLQPGQPTQPGTPGRQPGQQGAQQGASANDAKLAAWLAVDNQGEIVISQLAAQRASNEQVKQFAQQMVQDHTRLHQQLQQIAGHEAGAARANQDGLRQDTRRAGEAGTQPLNQPGRHETAATPQQAHAQGEHGLNFIALKRELGEQCVQSIRRDLESKQGAEFDKCYMFQQIIAHMHALDTMKVFQNHASPQLQQVINQGTRTAEQHLEHAKQIAKALDQDEPGSRAARTAQPGVRTE